MLRLNGALGFEGHAYFFGSKHYRRYNWNTDTLDDGGSLPIFVWHLPFDFHSDLDAAMHGFGDFANHAYFFKGSHYVRYNWISNRVDLGPASITAEWDLPLAFAANLDTALCGDGPYAGKAYFFKGSQYARFDWNSNKLDFIAPLSAWNLPSSFSGEIDAAINGWGHTLARRTSSKVINTFAGIGTRRW